MRIQRVYLDQVACFDRFNLAFGQGDDPGKADVHMLVGANGTGKTTILMALAQAFTYESVGLANRLRGPLSTAAVEMAGGELLAFRRSTPQGAPPTPVVPGAAAPLIHRYDCGDFTVFAGVPKETRAYRDLSRVFQPHAPGHQNTRFSAAAFAYSGQRSVGSYRLEAIQEDKESPLAGACAFNRPESSQRFVQWVANTRAKAAMAADRGDSALATRRRQSIERIETVISDITGQPFSFVLQDDPLWVGANFAGRVVGLDLLPDGLKSTLSWIGDLLMRMDRIPWEGDTPVLERPFLLFLDEIEVHLHPAWQRRVLPTVQGLFPKAQIFLSTHSPFVVASAADAWIYPLRMNGEHAEVGDPLPSQVGISYATVLREVLGVAEEFDMDTERLFARFYALKDRVLRGEPAARAEFEQVAGDLAARSYETSVIVGHERRRVERHEQPQAQTQTP